jgi:hypothetical protein
VALDLLTEAGMVGADARADVFRVSCFRGSGEADEIAEEDPSRPFAPLEAAKAVVLSGSAQNGQKGNSPGSSFPHEGQVVTNRV